MLRRVIPFLAHRIKHGTSIGAACTCRACSSFKHVPAEPVYQKTTAAVEEPEISDGDIALLERLSLVDFGNRDGVLRLKEAIKFASSIKSVDTAGVEPLYTVLEDRSLRLREDRVEEPPSVDEVLSCAAVTEDDYFVAPPGNVPLEVSNTYRDPAEGEAEPAASPPPDTRR